MMRIVLYFVTWHILGLPSNKLLCLPHLLQVLKAKAAAKLRHRQLDAKRRKFKEDLEVRENQARDGKESKEKAAQKLQQEIERLRKEGSKLLQREKEFLKQQMKDETEMQELTAAGTYQKCKKSNTITLRCKFYFCNWYSCVMYRILRAIKMAVVYN